MWKKSISFPIQRRLLYCRSIEIEAHKNQAHNFCSTFVSYYCSSRIATDRFRITIISLLTANRSTKYRARKYKLLSFCKPTIMFSVFSLFHSLNSMQGSAAQSANFGVLIDWKPSPIRPRELWKLLEEKETPSESLVWYCLLMLKMFYDSIVPPHLQLESIRSLMHSPLQLQLQYRFCCCMQSTLSLL